MRILESVKKWWGRYWSRRAYLQHLMSNIAAASWGSSEPLKELEDIDYIA